MLRYGHDSNVTKLLANLLTKPSVFNFFPIVFYNLVSIQIIIVIIIIITSRTLLYTLDKYKCILTRNIKLNSES